MYVDTIEALNHESLAADGRFFISSEPTDLSIGMYTFSQTVLVDTIGLLHDGRGTLLQFTAYETDELVKSGSVRQPTSMTSLDFDGSRLSMQELAWRYAVAVPDKGRTVQELYVSPSNLESMVFSYNQQGVMCRDTIMPDVSILAQKIRGIIESDVFRQKASEIAHRKLQAEVNFAQFMSDLISRGADLKIMKDKIDKQEAAAKRIGFAACSAIARK